MQAIGQIEKAITWRVGVDVIRVISHYYQTPMRAIIKHTGINNNWFTLYIVRGTEPEVFTLNRYQQLYPHIAKDQLQQKLNDLTEQGFLSVDPLDAYRLTKTGRKAIERTMQMAHREMGKIRALPYQEMQYLADLLHRIVINSIQFNLPIEKHMMKISRWTDVGEFAPMTTRIEQYLTDLKRYRHDAKIASWQQHYIEGEVWETFTMICEEKADTTTALDDLLQAHGHERITLAHALQSLEQRGWIAEGDLPNQYHITELGHIVYDEATHMTDQYFYAGWLCLSEKELQDLHYLLLQLHDTLQQAAA